MERNSQGKIKELKHKGNNLYRKIFYILFTILFVYLILILWKTL